MAESPFLQNTYIQYAWDSTSLGYLKTCPRLYYYHMIEGFVPKDESIHLRFGIEYHAALQNYDLERAANINYDDAIHDVVRATLTQTEDWDPDTDTKAGMYKNRKSLIRAVVWYLDHYRDDEAKTLILSDGKPAVEQSFRFELDFGPAEGQPYLLCGHLDKIKVYHGSNYFLDTKTTTWSLSQKWFDQWEPHNQMSVYSVASRVIFDSPIKGGIIDAVRLRKEDGEIYPEFARGFTYRNDDQLDEWLVDLRHWLDLAATYAKQGYWPQNDMACDKYGGCRFRDVCSKSPSVRDRFLEGSFNKQAPEERWNPLKAR